MNCFATHDVAPGPERRATTSSSSIGFGYKALWVLLAALVTMLGFLATPLPDADASPHAESTVISASDTEIYVRVIADVDSRWCGAFVGWSRHCVDVADMDARMVYLNGIEPSEMSFEVTIMFDGEKIGDASNGFELRDGATRCTAVPTDGRLDQLTVVQTTDGALCQTKGWVGISRPDSVQISVAWEFTVDGEVYSGTEVWEKPLDYS